MTDRTTQCVYCGGPMVPAPKFGSRWYKCTKCNGTYDVPLDLGNDALERDRTTAGGRTSPIRGMGGTGRPSKAVLKEAERARQAKKDAA